MPKLQRPCTIPGQQLRLNTAKDYKKTKKAALLFLPTNTAGWSIYYPIGRLEQLGCGFLHELVVPPQPASLRADQKGKLAEGKMNHLYFSTLGSWPETRRESLRPLWRKHFRNFKALFFCEQFCFFPDYSLIKCLPRVCTECLGNPISKTEKKKKKRERKAQNFPSSVPPRSISTGR